MTISRTILLSSIMALTALAAHGRGRGDAPADSLDVAADSGAVELREVVVSPEKVKVFADHDEMTLGPENRDFGANAIDAISSLPLFRTQVASSELTNLKGEKVSVVIDGRFASPGQLAAYSGREIRSVSYYPFTPSRYQAWCSGPLVEVSIIRPRDAYVRVNLLGNAMGQVTDDRPADPVSSAANATLTYMDSVNMLKGDYRFGCLDNRHLVREIGQATAGTHTLYRTDRGRERRTRHQATLNYQRDKGGSTFSAIAGYARVPRYRLDMPMESADGTRDTHSRQDQEAVSASLFYDRGFRDRSSLTLSAEGSLTRTSLSESLDISGPSPQGFHRNTDVDSRALRLFLNAGYIRPLGKGELGIFADAMADAMRQRYLGERVPDAHGTHFSARASYKVSPGRLSFDLSAAYAAMDNSSGDRRTAVSRPVGSVRMGWRINRRMSLRLSSSAGISYNTQGLDYDNRYYDGEGYYQQGNFYVRPTTNTCHAVDFSYTGSDGRVAGGLSASLQYDINPFFQYVTEKDGDYVRTTLNSGDFMEFLSGIYASFRPADWLTAYLSTSFRRYNSPAPSPDGNAAELHSRLDVSLQVTASYRNIYISADARNGGRAYSGDMVTRTPVTASVQAAWQNRHVLASLTWGYNLGHSTTVMESGAFMWSEFSPAYRQNVLSLTLTYTFSHGAYRHRKVKGQSVGTSSGLGRGKL